MIFEWYSGTDKARRIARSFNELYYEASEEQPVEQVARELDKLAAEEQDPNMKAKIVYRSLRLLRGEGQWEAAGERVQQALALFDPLAANFPSVAEEYALANSAMIDSAENMDGEEVPWFMAPHGLAVVLWGEVAGLEDETKLSWLGILADFFAFCGMDFGQPLFFKIAELVCAREHHAFPENASTLITWAYAKSMLGDRQGYLRILEMIRDLEGESERYKQVLSFSQNFPLGS